MLSEKPQTDDHEPPGPAATGAERLLNRDFLLLVQARFVSNLGHAATHIALIYWVMQVTGSATQMGIVASLSAIPSVLAAPVGGFLADRFSRKVIMIVNDLFRAAVLILLPVMMWGGVDETLVLYYLYFAAFAMATSASLFLPATNALMPQLVPKASLNRANALTQGTTSLTQLMGQSAGGILYRILGPATLFLVDAITYFISALSIAFIREPKRQERPDDKTPLLDAFVRDTREGIGYCWNQRGLRKILLAALLLNFFASPTLMLLPLLVDKVHQLPADWYGYMLGAFLGGSLAGMGLVGVFDMRGIKRWLSSLAAYTLTGIGFLLIGSAPPPVITTALFFGLGAATSILNVLLIARMQESVANEILGRVMAAMSVMAMGIVPIAMLLAGIIVDMLDQNVLPLFIATGIAILCFTIYMAVDRDVREFLGSDT